METSRRTFCKAASLLEAYYTKYSSQLLLRSFPSQHQSQGAEVVSLSAAACTLSQKWSPLLYVEDASLLLGLSKSSMRTVTGKFFAHVCA